jgi:hypothetical protein
MEVGNSSAFASAVQGLRRAVDSANNTGAEIAKQASSAVDKQSDADINEPLVKLRVEEVSIATSSRALETADSTIGTLINIAV